MYCGPSWSPSIKDPFSQRVGHPCQDVESSVMGYSSDVNAHINKLSPSRCTFQSPPCQTIPFIRTPRLTLLVPAKSWRFEDGGNHPFSLIVGTVLFWRWKPSSLYVCNEGKQRQLEDMLHLVRRVLPMRTLNGLQAAGAYPSLARESICFC